MVKFPSATSTMMFAATKLLLAGGVQAFQPQQAHQLVFTPPTSPLSKSQTALQSTRIDNTNAIGKSYDFDELMDSEMEQARLSNQYARFGHQDWLRHRASDRFFRNLLKFDQSPIVKNLLDEAVVLAVISIGIIVWNELLVDGYTDLNEVHHAAPLADVLPSFLAFKFSLPIEPFLLCGGSLGLLLVFRNDCSFGRYKEAFHHMEVAMSSLSNMQLMASNVSKNVEGVKQMGIASWVLFRTLQHEVSGAFDPVDKYESSGRQTAECPFQVVQSTIRCA